MYLPEHYTETRIPELLDLIRDYPLGTLVVHGPDGLDANHLPFFMVPKPDGQRSLHAHVARANPLWTEAKNGDDVLVIFQGPAAYISPNWYPSKFEFHRQVPTWNYQVVHVHGRIRMHDDEHFVRGVVARLTQTHEARQEGSSPWKMSDSPSEFIAQMLAAIVGIEIEITRMIGKWKLSQNREDRDRIGAENALERRGDGVLSEAMRTMRIRNKP